MPSLNLSLPDDLHNDLQRLATAEERSLTRQIVYMLKRGVDQANNPQPAAAPATSRGRPPKPEPRFPPYNRKHVGVIVPGVTIHNLPQAFVKKMQSFGWCEHNICAWVRDYYTPEQAEKVVRKFEAMTPEEFAAYVESSPNNTLRTTPAPDFLPEELADLQRQSDRLRAEEEQYAANTQALTADMLAAWGVDDDDIIE